MVLINHYTCLAYMENSILNSVTKLNILIIQQIKDALDKNRNNIRLMFKLVWIDELLSFSFFPFWEIVEIVAFTFFPFWEIAEIVAFTFFPFWEIVEIVELSTLPLEYFKTSSFVKFKHCTQFIWYLDFGK